MVVNSREEFIVAMEMEFGVNGASRHGLRKSQNIHSKIGLCCI